MRNPRPRAPLSWIVPLLLWCATVVPIAAQTPLRFFISVDMEGIGGIGTGAMTSAGGKDYELSRRLATAEVNTVVEAILSRHPDALILVNDSHGDMQNLLHLELDPRVAYIQGSRKPLGMVQGLEADHAGAFFLGYHTRAGDLDGFLAHTGTGAVKGLWLNGVEVGEGGLNAAFAGSLGVPVLLAAGDSAFAREIAALTDPVTVVTKVAVTPASARLFHPEAVRDRLRAGVGRALDRRTGLRPWRVQEPVEVRLRFDGTLRPDILEAIPEVSRVDGYTVAFTAPDMDRAYRMIRLMYRYVSEG